MPPTTRSRPRPQTQVPPSAPSPRAKPGASPSPAQLAYFVIFNPKLATKRPNPSGDSEGARPKDGGAGREEKEVKEKEKEVEKKAEQEVESPSEREGTLRPEALPLVVIPEGISTDDGLGITSASPTPSSESVPMLGTGSPLDPQSSAVTEAATPASERSEPTPSLAAEAIATPAEPLAPTPQPAALPIPNKPPLSPKTPRVDPGDRDRDLEDDLREATQIVFYTSRDAGGVSRDTMLRQVGLAKGLMGFSDMIDHTSDPFWAVHSQNTRLIIYTPEPDWFIYICVTLALVPLDAKKDEVAPAQGISDRMLVDGLQRGYDDYAFLHGTFDGNLTTPASLSQLEKYWTHFAFSFESALINPPQPGLMTWLGGFAPSPAPPLDTTPLENFASDHLAPGSGVGVLGRDKMLACTGDGALPSTDSREYAALVRFLLTSLHAQLPVEQDPPPVMKATSDRQTLGFGFGRRRGKDPKGAKDSTRASSSKDIISPTTMDAKAPPAIPAAAPPKGDKSDEREKDAEKDKDERKTSWGLGGNPLSWVGLGSAPLSRAVTPSPMEKKASGGSVVECEPIPRRSVSHSHTPSASSVSSLRRWNFGDVMGNMGAALGLSPAPSPRVPEFKSEGDDKGDKSSKAEGDGGVSDSNEPANVDEDGDGKDGNSTGAHGGMDTEASNESATDPVSTTPATSPTRPVPNESSIASNYDTPAAMLGTSVQSRDYVSSEGEERDSAPSEDVSRTPTPGPDAALPEEIERTPTPAHALVDEPPPPEPPVIHEIAATPKVDIPNPLETPTAERQTALETIGAAATAADTTPTPTVTALPTLTPETARGVLPALLAASDDRVDVTWLSKAVYLDGAKRRLSWVVRDATLLYTLTPDAGLAEPPSGSATVGTFDALAAALAPATPISADGMSIAGSLSASTGDKDKKSPAPPEDTTIHHFENVTDRTGKMHGADGVLSALRDVISTPTAPTDVYAQLPNGRFVVAKKAASGAELFVVTARKEASLTDAERAVRGYAFVRPEFS